MRDAKKLSCSEPTCLTFFCADHAFYVQCMFRHGSKRVRFHICAPSDPAGYEDSDSWGPHGPLRFLLSPKARPVDLTVFGLMEEWKSLQQAIINLQVYHWGDFITWMYFPSCFECHCEWVSRVWSSLCDYLLPLMWANTWCAVVLGCITHSVPQFISWDLDFLLK